MDKNWIDPVCESKKGKQQSVKRVFYYYVFVMFAIVLLLSGIAVKVCISMRDKIIASHAYVYEPSPNMTAENEDIYTYGYIIPSDNTSSQNKTGNLKNDIQVFTAKDKMICHMFEILTFFYLFYLYV